MKLPGWISRPPTGATRVADRPRIPGDGAPAVGDGIAGATSGVAGNSRLTAATGLVLLVLLAVEGVTLLGVRGMLTLHVAIGALLVGPYLLKCGTTVYRFTRYYTGSPAYRSSGPPPLVLRIVGPLLIASTAALLATGIALVVAGPGESRLLLTAHQTSFWVWVGLMSVHVLGHLCEATVLTWHDLRSSGAPGAARRRWRMAAIAVALMVGVGTAAVLVPPAASWNDRPERPVAHAPSTSAPQP